MALNPLFKKKTGADWENKTNYATPTPTPVIVAPPPPPPAVSTVQPTKLTSTTPGQQYNFMQTPAQNFATIAGTSGASTKPVINNPPPVVQTPKVVSTPAPIVKQQPIVSTQPQVATQPTALNLRDVATQNNIAIGNQGNMPTINGQVKDPSQFGLTLSTEGRWQGTPEQISSYLGMGTPLRQTLEGQGINVGYDSATGQVTAGGMNTPISTKDMINIGGRYYGTQDLINQIAESTKPQGQIQGQEIPQEQGVTPREFELSQQYEEQKRQNEELKAMYDKLNEIQIPEEDFTYAQDNLKLLQDYKAPYDEAIGQLLGKMFEGFNYEPTNDPMLEQAIKYADKGMMEEMNRRGVLSSTMTTDNMRTIREDLLPKYQDMALQNYNQQLNRYLSQVNVLQSINKDDYNKYKEFINTSMDVSEKMSKNTVATFKDNLNLMYKQVEQKENALAMEAKLKADTIKNAYQKIKDLGYVDNDTSIITGLPVGTLSQEAQAKALEEYHKYNQIAIKADADAKQREVEYQYDIKKIDYQQDIKNQEEKRKANMSAIYAQLSTMNPKDALVEVNKNYGDLYEYLGSELMTLTDKLQKQIQQQTENELKVKAENRAIEQQNISNARANSAEARAQRAEERTIQKETIKAPSKNEIQESWANDYTKVKDMSYDEAYANLTDVDNREKYIAVYGWDGYKDLYNNVLSGAFKDPYFNKKMTPLIDKPYNPEEE